MTLVAKILPISDRLLGLARRLEWLPLLLVRWPWLRSSSPAGGESSTTSTKSPASSLSGFCSSFQRGPGGDLRARLWRPAPGRTRVAPGGDSAGDQHGRGDHHGETSGSLGITDLFAVDEFIYIVMAAVVIVFGAGAASLDGLIGRWLSRRTALPPARGTP